MSEQTRFFSGGHAIESLENRHLVEQFWAAMQANDWQAAGTFLHDDYVLEWPQSNERIRGRSNFIAINQHYPAAGRWRFVVNRIVADAGTVVTDVSVTDGEQSGHAITFSEIRDGQIGRQIEYWPDPFEAPAWRTQWVEQIHSIKESRAC